MAEYIDRQKVIDIINTTCPDLNIPELNDSWANKLIGVIREALVELVKQAPAADVRENVKGKWIESSGATIDIKASSDCSQCGALGSPHFKYCWKCGAKMRGGGTCDGDSCTL